MKDQKNLIRRVLDLTKEEIPVALLMFSFFFLVITVFQILKPLKNGLFVHTFGAFVELYAKLGNIAVAVLAMIGFTFLFNHTERHRLIYVLCSFFIGCFVLFAFLLNHPATVPIWGFYMLGDLVPTVMVAAFWAYLTDITTTDQAKRLYGLIGAGGVIGGWIGTSISKFLLNQIGQFGLLWLSALLMSGVILIIFVTERKVRRSALFVKPPGRVKEQPKLTDALEGARLALRSSYIAAIVGLVGFYEFGSQIMDYIFKKSTEHIGSVAATQASLANVYFYANALAVIVQLFLVSFMMKRFGAKVALLIGPIAVILSSIGYLITSELVALLVISDNGLNYSMQQTARESLYVVTTHEEKYKARAFTNMFIQRLGKGAGSLTVILLGWLAIIRSPRYLSFIVISMMVLIILLGSYAGRHFAERTRE